MKRYIFPIILVVLALGFIYARPSVFNKATNNSVSETSQKTMTASLLLDFGNGETKTFEKNISDTDTAFSILKLVSEAENIKLETIQYDFGIFVKKIGDLESTAKKSWIYYVNGESGQIAADQNTIKNGDKVEWRYEIPKL